MKITGCIFDLDGTLLDTMKLWSKVGHDYIVSMGKNPHDDLDKKLREMSMQQASAYFIEDYGIVKSPEEIAQGINDIMEDNYKYRAFPKEGVLDFLEEMMKKGVKMCIASATDTYLIEYALKANNMEKYFGKIFSCIDVGSGKDKPHIYNEALKFLGTDKETTYVFEDALYAVNTLKDNDFNVVGIADKFSDDHREFIKNKADIFVNSFCELKDIF